MRNRIVSIVCATLLATTAVCAVSAVADPLEAQASATVTLHVDGMHCATCPITVRVAATRLAGVTSAMVNMEQASAVVVYDPARVTPAQIIEAIASAGYPARLDD